MNFRIVWRTVGKVLLIEAGLMLLPLVTALVYHESPVPFLLPMAVTALVGFLLSRVKAGRGVFTAREGFVIVGLSWILMSLSAAVPFVLAEDIPNYLDAVFETVSGLTTTGATILSDVEALSRSGQFWRLFRHESDPKKGTSLDLFFIPLLRP